MYTEWVPTGKFVKATISAVASTIIIVLAMIAVFIQPLDTEAVFGMGVSAAVLAFILVLFLNFRGIKIQLNHEKLTVDYGWLNRKSIKLDEVVSCRLVEASFSRFGGVGVRYGVDGSWAYTTSFGNAVEVVPKEGRTFVFSSNNPQQICQTINSRIRRQEPKVASVN
jgi:hypothetical protein